MLRGWNNQVYQPQRRKLKILCLLLPAVYIPLQTFITIRSMLVYQNCRKARVWAQIQAECFFVPILTGGPSLDCWSLRRGTGRTGFSWHELAPGSAKLSTQGWRWEAETCPPAQSKSLGRCNAVPPLLTTCLVSVWKSLVFPAVKWA